MRKADLDKRMKEFYENISKTKLLRRTPVAIRIDGKAFHTFTRDMKKPFDDVLVKSMQETMKYLCENIQGCVLGYTQSDEITLILVDYQKLNSSAWFDYEVQKLCSIAASMATMQFNRVFAKNVEIEKNYLKTKDHADPSYNSKDDEAYIRVLDKAIGMGAMFDARCFNIPKEEVTNLIYWRQNDASKNSIQMVGQAYFPPKELYNKTCSMIQEMLHEERGINWNDYAIPYKRGTSCIKTEDEGWVIDYDMPILKGPNRAYVDRLVIFESEE